MATPGKKSHLGSCLDKPDRATVDFGRDRSHRKPGKISYWRGFPNPSRRACHSLPSSSSTSNHSEGLSACLITETFRRAELYGWGRRLFVHVCHLFVDQWKSFGDRERPDRALLAAGRTLAGIPAASRTNPRCLLCICTVCLVNREAAARSILTWALVLYFSSSGRPARQGRRLMRRTSRGGWLSRLLAAKRQKVGLGTPSSNCKTENQTKARRLRHANAGPNTGPRYAGYCAARGRARILLAGVHR